MVQNHHQRLRDPSDQSHQKTEEPQAIDRVPQLRHQQPPRGQQRADEVQTLRPLRLHRMGFTPLCPSRAVRRLRREPRLIHIGQLDLASLGLLDQVFDLASGLLEPLRVPFFFKL